MRWKVIKEYGSYRWVNSYPSYQEALEAYSEECDDADNHAGALVQLVNDTSGVFSSYVNRRSDEK